MKDYYRILGVEEDASEEEIRSRWIELTKQYHPDLKGRPGDEEKIREINEAYEVLKNVSKRMEYDLQRTLKKSLVKKIYGKEERKVHLKRTLISLGFIIMVSIFGILFYLRYKSPSEVTCPIVKPVEERVARVIPSEKEIEPIRSQEERKVLIDVKPREKPPVEIPAKKELILKEKNLREPEARPKAIEKEVQEKTSAEDLKKTIPLEAPDEKITVIPKENFKENQKEIREVTEGSPRVVLKEASQEPEKETTKETTREPEKKTLRETVRREIPRESVKEAPRELIKEPLKEIHQKTSIEPLKELVREPSKVLSEEISKEISKTFPTKIVEGSPQKTSLMIVKEDEVKTFLMDYIDRYMKKDIEGFLSLFSPKAIQNQKEGYDEIRKIYSKFFDQSEKLHYQIEDTRVEIGPEQILVKARYRVDQVLKKGGREKIWKGRIQWILKKEEGKLKIISLDYQHES